MLNLDNICSLSEFQRNTKSVLEHIKQTGLPQVLTLNGKAEVVVQDASAYQKILDLIDRLEAIEGIKRGLKSMEQQDGRPAEETLQRIADKYDIPIET